MWCFVYSKKVYLRKVIRLFLPTEWLRSCILLIGLISCARKEDTVIEFVPDFTVLSFIALVEEPLGSVTNN